MDFIAWSVISIFKDLWLFWMTKIEKNIIIQLLTLHQSF